ncbi:MAG: thymidine kinase [Marinoscillum sp.]|jgi:thymidine kinase
MFVEPNIGKHAIGKTGWVEVVCGSMFSGKTEELIRRLNRALIAQQKVEIFKPVVDKRYSKQKVVSHNENAIMSTPVNFANDILLRAGHCDVVGVDEAQFFDDQIINVCNELANQGKRVIVAGLDMDFLGNPFSPMDRLMATAEYITKVHAICMNCGNIASYSYRRTKSKQTVVLGEKDIYEALCRKCFYERMD